MKSVLTVVLATCLMACGYEPSAPSAPDVSKGEGAKQAPGNKAGKTRGDGAEPDRIRLKATLDRATLQAAMADKTAPSGFGRALPHVGEDGEADGYRITGIEAGSLPAKAGIKNGDVIKGVNGHPILDVGQAMKAMKALEGTDVLKFNIDRKGSPVRLVVRVTDATE